MAMLEPKLAKATLAACALFITILALYLIIDGGACEDGVQLAFLVILGVVLLFALLFVAWEKGWVPQPRGHRLVEVREAPRRTTTVTQTRPPPPQRTEQRIEYTVDQYGNVISAKEESSFSKVGAVCSRIDPMSAAVVAVVIGCIVVTVLLFVLEGCGMGILIAVLVLAVVTAVAAGYGLYDYVFDEQGVAEYV